MNKEQYSAQAVVLAGGRGTRMGELTKDKQKCLLPIDGRPVLGYVMESLVEAFGSVEITFCLFYRAEDVIDYVKKNKPNKTSVHFLHDRGDSKTANIVSGTKDSTADLFIVTAGDIVVKPKAYREGYELLINKEDRFGSVVLSARLENADTHAVGKLEGGRVIEFLYPPQSYPDNDHLRDMTIWVFNQEYYDFSEKHPELFSVSQVLGQAIRDNKYVSGHQYEGEWVHLGYPEDLSKTAESVT